MSAIQLTKFSIFFCLLHYKKKPFLSYTVVSYTVKIQASCLTQQKFCTITFQNLTDARAFRFYL